MTNLSFQENALYKIAEFNTKITKVNHLYEYFRRKKTEDSKNLFSKEWNKLHSEVSDFFGLNIETAEASNHKKIIAFTDLSFKVEDFYIYNEDKFAQGEKSIRKSEICFSIFNHEDKGASGFPYFGLLIELVLNYENGTKFSVVIAKSKRGCGRLFASQFDTENLTINSPKIEIQFEKAEEFTTIYRLCEDSVEAVNKALVNKLTNNIEICQK